MFLVIHARLKYAAMKGDVVCQLILILLTAMHWVMVLEPSFKVGRLD